MPFSELLLLWFSVGRVLLMHSFFVVDQKVKGVVFGINLLVTVISDCYVTVLDALLLFLSGL